MRALILPILPIVTAAILAWLPVAILPAVETAGESTATAADLAARGRAAMQESNVMPARIVDAAILFTQSLKLYQTQGDLEQIQDLQANIFWCKKRMNLVELQAYLEQKNQDVQAKAALVQVDAIAASVVPAAEADAYFKRAQEFALKHPDDHYAVAVRFYEVAERFQGSETSLKAQRLSLDAQSRHLAAVQAGGEKHRATLFSRPAAVAAGSRLPVPAADAQRKAVVLLKDLYKDDYAKDRPKLRRAFALRLVDLAQATADDPVMRYAALREAGELALLVPDPTLMVSTIDLIAAQYSGVDAAADKRAWLQRVRGLPVATAMITLLAKPEDPVANAAVGRHYCFELGEWDLGLAMLAIGGDAELAALAEMEIDQPTESANQLTLGDHWYDLAKKTRDTSKDDMLARANVWYAKAAPTLVGLSKDRIAKRQAEIEAAMPNTKLDWSNLTARQWDQLKGITLQVRAGVASQVAKVVHTKPVRVVPHPTDAFQIRDALGIRDATWQGAPSRQVVRFKGANRRPVGGNAPNDGAMTVQVGKGKEHRPGDVIAEDGILVIDTPLPNRTTASGVIRVKIVDVED